MDNDRLTKMANQIAGFFDTQPGDAAKGTADHLNSFWDPRMRKSIVAHLQAGGQGLEPTAMAAVRLLEPKVIDSSPAAVSPVVQA